jgi:hypothetical protein
MPHSKGFVPPQLECGFWLLDMNLSTVINVVIYYRQKEMLRFF